MIFEFLNSWRRAGMYVNAYPYLVFMQVRTPSEPVIEEGA